MNGYTIMLDGDAGVGGLLAGIVILGADKVDVVGFAK